MELEKLHVINEKIDEKHIDKQVHLYGWLYQLAVLAGKARTVRIWKT